MIGYDSIEYASLTDVGIRRSHNQDAHASLLAGDGKQWEERGHIFLVADGMGAHAVGELASQLAVGIIPHTYHKHAPQEGVPALRKAFVEANASIHAKGQQNPEFGGMGTTTTALLLRPEGAWVGHVGDSRAYRIRAGQIEQMSFDHSLVWEMARRQGVDPEGLQGIPSNVIVRSLGPEPLVQVDVEGPHPVQPGDIFLLCSDGLSGQVSDTEIGAIACTLPPAEACHVLVDLANLRGGPDNITVVIVRIKESTAGQPANAPARRKAGKRIGWPYLTLLAGLALVGVAVVFKNWDFSAVAILAFLLSAAAILAGVIGVALQIGQEKPRPVPEPARRPKIYRQCACHVERSAVDKIARTVDSLREQVQERKWDLDWAEFDRHHAHAAELLAQGKLTDCFAEKCRALRLLAEAIQGQRPRGEDFRPLWDSPR